MRRIVVRALVALLYLGVASAAGADGVVLYGASKLTNGAGGGDGHGASTLYRLDPATGVVQPVAPIRDASGVAFRNVSGLAFQGTTLFAASNDEFAAESVLLDVDPVTGIATAIGTIMADGNPGECRNVADLAWDASTGTLFGMGDFCDGAPVNDTLITINPATGAGTPLGLSGIGAGNAIAARPVTGTLVRSNSFGSLGVLNKIDGSSTDLPGSSAWNCCYSGADFDPDSGLLYFVLRDGDGDFGANQSFLVQTDVDAALISPEVVGTLRDSRDIPLQGFDALAFYTVNADACFPGPLDGCKEPTNENASSLKLKPKATNPQKNKLSFSWKKGEATTVEEFGNPVGVTDYRLCVYDETGRIPGVVVDAAIPAGLSWKAKKNGFQYKDKQNPSGIQKVSLKAGDDGKSQIKVSGKGVVLPALPLAQDPTVTAQLVNDDGECWSASYSFPASKNDLKQFKDKSDAAG